VFAEQIYIHSSQETQGFNYFPNKNAVLEKMYCYFVPNKDPGSVIVRHGMSFISLMIQVSENDASFNGLQGVYSIFKAFKASSSGLNTLPTSLSTYLDIKEVRPMDKGSETPISATIRSTVKQACNLNEVPNPLRTFCECNAGYRFQGSRCVACQLGWYKPSPGNIECQQCPIGKTTLAIGSSQCVSVSDIGNNNSTQPSQQQSINDLLPIIIGSAVGGVVFIIIIISVVCFYS